MRGQKIGWRLVSGNKGLGIGGGVGYIYIEGGV